MKTRRLLLLAAGIAGLAIPLPQSLAQAFNLDDPDWMVDQLDSAVGLSPTQRTQASEIIHHTVAALLALPEADRMEKSLPLREEMRRQIRALLTPEQQLTYDHAPQAYGGGRTLITPETMLARLDALVTLTDDQKAAVLNVFEAESQVLLSIPEADRPQQGAAARREALAAVRAYLTPEQQWKYDRTPQMFGGGLTLMSPESKVARLNALVMLTDAQKTAARKAFETELDALLAIPEADRPAQGAAARQGAMAAVRALLTPEQQAIFDATPVSRGGGGPDRKRPGGAT